MVDAWQSIVAVHGVSGKQTYDAHIVAMMQVHSLASILTFNDRHFKRYPGIKVLNPAQIEALNPPSLLIVSAPESGDRAGDGPQT